MPPPIPAHLSQWLMPALEALRAGEGKPCLTGLHGSTAGFSLALLTHRLPAHPFPDRSWLIVAKSDEEAERLHADTLFFRTLLGQSGDDLACFPKWETLPYESTAPHIDLVARRMRTLHRLSTTPRTVLFTSVPALTQRVLPALVLHDAILQFQPNGTIERETLVSSLLRLGYQKSSVVEIPGEFSIRGGIVDIYSTAYPDPLRVEFLGDTIESLRLFDPSTQQSTDKIKQALVLPARELIRPEDAPDALAPLTADAEWHAPAVYGAMDSVLDYFPQPPLLVLDQPATLKAQSETCWKAAEEGYLRHEDRSDPNPYPTPDRLYLTWDQILADTQRCACLALEPVTPPDASWAPVLSCPAQTPASVGLGLRGTAFSQTLDVLDRLRENGPVALVARSQGQVGRLLALFREHDRPAVEWTPSALSAGGAQKAPFAVLNGDVSAGFLSADLRLVVLTEEELFAKGARHKPPPKSKAATFLSSLEDLNVGDFVVHVQYGIARYQGLRRLSVQEFDSDYLVLEFAGTDKLYVPLDRLHQVQRYAGAESHVPRLDRLGGTSWAKTTARVKKDIEEMAHELVELYANRELVQRTSYAQDSLLYHEFEAAFEYEETPDQRRAIQDIINDMASTKPMDRLVCGDVGYGKTEVAMRAAFKAVNAGKQVAMLVPTTVLALQHFSTFTQRLAAFPVKIEMLSRLRSEKEQRHIIAGLADGSVDIVIGTHRLVQRDVRFKDLGLVIVDEEQRFGVRQKEFLKQLRTEVDIITMSATPIPRTLHIALAGIRDISIIETAPNARLPIRTFVTKTNDQLIRDVILREIERGGQVFFVHNRVKSIGRVVQKLHEIVPEARIGVGHGQMDEDVLESVMVKFVQGEFDVLVCTTIIESGVDIPNANTIVIDDADTFGLTQLYQLRGRVGRGTHRAYAYLLVRPDKPLSAEAEARLEAIQEATELGSGMRIALRDMEIRGAGNLLGAEQSGHIAEVGYELYLRLLAQAVEEARRGAPMQEVEAVTMDLPITALLPASYIPDVELRLTTYRAISGIENERGLREMRAELEDRFGELPDEVEHLLALIALRIRSERLGITSIVEREREIVIRPVETRALNNRKLIGRFGHAIKITPNSVRLRLMELEESWSSALDAILDEIELVEERRREQEAVIAVA